MPHQFCSKCRLIHDPLVACKGSIPPAFLTRPHPKWQQRVDNIEDLNVGRWGQSGQGEKAP